MILKNSNIFLNGGAGFMGSHLVELLSKENHLTVYDNFSAAVVTEQWLQSFPKVTVIRGDIRDKEKLVQAMQGHDSVIHLAAAHIRLSLSEPTQVHDINTTGILNSLFAAKTAKIKRFLYLSSSEIYGSAVLPLLNEDHAKDPTTVYGVSKYVGELYTQYFNRHEHVPSTIIRLFNTYGPRAHFEEVYGEVIPRMCMRALAGLSPIIFGNGDQTRDFTYITDTIRGIILVLSADKAVGDVVNIAYGEEISIRRIAEIICKETGVSAGPTILPARPNDVMRHAADTTKAKNLLGWKHEVSVEEGIRKYIAWLKKTYPDPKKMLEKIPNKNW